MHNQYFCSFKTISSFALIILLYLSCKKDHYPECLISTPIDGQNFVQGEIVQIMVDSYDSDGQIVEVLIYIDGSLETKLNESPYMYKWNTSECDIGSHKIRVESCDEDGLISKAEITIMLSEKIIADFNAEPTNGNIPLFVNFTDLSTNNPTGWFWDFGDGNSSTEQNPTHTYNSSGIYTVSLRAFNEICSDTLVKEELIVAGLVFAEFTASETYGNQVFTTTFYDASLNDPFEWSWNFGDGSTSTDQNPTHTYETIGAYDVSLTATNEYGANTIKKLSFIIVNDENELYFTDGRDGKEYTKVVIGDQTWSAPNLRFESPNSRWFNDNPDNDETLGRLYTWYDALNACPAGWHLPSDDEWKILEGTIDNTYPVGHSEWDKFNYRGDGAGNKLKSTSGWSIAVGTDAYGFKALPAGGFYANGNFTEASAENCLFWTSTEYSDASAIFRGIPNGKKGLISRFGGKKDDGISVRCIRDE